MPRTSVAELMIQENVAEVPRPDAPYDLSDAEANVWRAICASMPAAHFSRGNYGLLAQLCRHLVAARMLGAIIAAETKKKQIDTKLYQQLLASQEKQSNMIVKLCRSMRLSQGSVTRAKSPSVRPLNGVQATGMVQNPWEDDE
jgi:hypothetical protein